MLLLGERGRQRRKSLGLSSLSIAYNKVSSSPVLAERKKPTALALQTRPEEKVLTADKNTSAFEQSVGPRGQSYCCLLTASLNGLMLSQKPFIVAASIY